MRELLDTVAKSRVPCMSIMTMPPLPYLARVPGLPMDALKGCYTDASVWQSFDPATLTLCSPDPQAFRPPDEPVNVLQVSLPTNFKVAKFDDEKSNVILRQMQDDIEAVRFEVDGKKVELPVKLKVHDSVFVPLAKWAMLLTGNYRCVQKDTVRPIKEAVHTDPAASKAVYNWVVDLCVGLGAPGLAYGAYRAAEAAAALSLCTLELKARATTTVNIPKILSVAAIVAGGFSLLFSRK